MKEKEFINYWKAYFKNMGNWKENEFMVRTEATLYALLKDTNKKILKKWFSIDK